MEKISDEPKQDLLSDSLTFNSDLKPLKVKILNLKGTDEQSYSIIFNLFEKSIILEALDLNDISNTKYLSILTLEDFQKKNYFFNQYDEITGIFELIEDMKEDEFKIEKNNSEFIEFFFLVEIRKKINEIKIDLKIQKADIEKIVYNICEKIKELNVIKNEIKNLKNNNNLIIEIEILKEKNKSLENIINNMGEKIENKIRSDDEVINDLKEKNKSLIQNLEKKRISDDEEIYNLKEKNKELNEKLKNITKELEKYKKENKNDLNKINEDIKNNNKNIIKNKEDIEKNQKYINNYGIIFNLNNKIFNELSDSLEYITKYNILIDSNIIQNNFELAQINNGIKHQLNKNIKRINLLYRCSVDGDSISEYHNKCDKHNNLLFLVETSENRKFGGYTSLYYCQSGGYKTDNNAFIFSLNNKENYYIKKGKKAICLDNRGPVFGQNGTNGSEFHIMNSNPCLTGYNSYDDTGKNNCYNYGRRKHVLAGKLEFVVLDFEVFQIEL